MFRARSFVAATPLQPNVTARLEEALRANVTLVAERVAEAARYKKMYERASALAAIGIWECDIATSTLSWTDGVYDLFELERGSVVDREVAAAMYDPASRAEMERLRAQAIATCGSFTLDIRIRTARGNDRWIRLTADVECKEGVAVQLFGTKQDITDETHLWTQMRRMAEQDPLTGLANRGRFQVAFDGADRMPLAALVLIDLDAFKQVNDGHGHAAGDECLRQIAGRVRRAMPRERVVARLGGDEFAVLVGAEVDAATIYSCIRKTLTGVARPILWRDTVLLVGASVGVAVPADAAAFDGAMLFAQADAALYASKAAGKGTARVYSDANLADRYPIRRPAAILDYAIDEPLPFAEDSDGPGATGATLRDAGFPLLQENGEVRGANSGLIATPC
jgi:diguanylate cyclase (GGDEF)-like protein